MSSSEWSGPAQFLSLNYKRRPSKNVPKPKPGLLSALAVFLHVLQCVNDPLGNRDFDRDHISANERVYNVTAAGISGTPLFRHTVVWEVDMEFFSTVVYQMNTQIITKLNVQV